ncbi:T9SS type A sorting domain-containing protein [Flavobacterium humi]|uniref:T9SS type A sorting domain-containing protein n=1 Tax=Flavobacterium humi TaxID=2562683 RepID=A0A4Z0LD86_9FLAO|nr:T9SS type A sorting domain-containing protein [Flavobacterium humi]TGD59849.1 T9SS type A sorting domain-containing protein [Flavobacterium humi]
MKKLYFLLLAFGFFTGINAQIVNIPDANFKNKLLTLNCADFNNDGIFDGDVDVNNDGEIQENEAQNVIQLNIVYTYISAEDETYLISNLEGLNSFVNLKRISFDYISFNNIDVDLSQLSQLEFVKINNSNTDLMGSINLSNLTHLISLDLNFNRFYDTALPNDNVNVNLNGSVNLMDLTYYNSCLNFNFCQIPNLKNLNCFYLEGGEPVDGIFDFSCLTKLETLTLGDNFMNVLILKNGSLLNSIIIPMDSGYPKPKFICIDDNSQELQQILNSGLVGFNTVINSYCSFEPGGQYYTIKGKNKFDTNNNGCDELDIVYPNLKLITNEANPETIISNLSGEYKTIVQAGNVLVTPIIENPDYFAVSPTAVAVSFPVQLSPFIQDFCITPNGIHSDLELKILPLVSARPGFDAKYKIVYKNKGNLVENGSVNFTFDDSKIDFVSATNNPAQTTGLLTWNYNNLQPFETRIINVVLNINSPMETPSVNGGDVLIYNATIASANTDELPNNNTFTLNQTVENSYDPNDITCLEGTSVSTAKIGDYVHYMIRFENTGSANATNIVVKDVVDLAKFDVNSIVPFNGSHDFYTRINGDKVEFIFENINLPFDDATNDGYVSFKIKTKSTLVAGDTFSKNANIYFDYNFPIVTNTATTTIAALGVQDFEFSNYFNVYPNPVHDVLTISAKETIEISSISIYNTIGQLVMVIPNAKNIKTVDVSNLASGNYFIKIQSDKGVSNTKFIKN